MTRFRTGKRLSTALVRRSIAIAIEGDSRRQMVEHVIRIPQSHELLLPIVEVVPSSYSHTTSSSAAAATSTSREI